jgi:hypothetical protein
MLSQKTHFEQIPLEVVRKIVEDWFRQEEEELLQPEKKSEKHDEDSRAQLRLDRKK